MDCLRAKKWMIDCTKPGVHMCFPSAEITSVVVLFSNCHVFAGSVHELRWRPCTSQPRELCENIVWHMHEIMHQVLSYSDCTEICIENVMPVTLCYNKLCNIGHAWQLGGNRKWQVTWWCLLRGPSIIVLSACSFCCAHLQICTKERKHHTSWHNQTLWMCITKVSWETNREQVIWSPGKCSPLIVCIPLALNIHAVPR